MVTRPTKHQNHQGFTLVEAMIVVAILGIVAAIAFPNYRSYTIKTKRTDAMTHLQNIASQIQADKLAQGSYNTLDLAKYTGVYPVGSTGADTLYNITANNIDLDVNKDRVLGDWKITAVANPSGMMSDDGNISLDANGAKCKKPPSGGEVCKGEDWNK